ncbi:MAG: hypothetical protein ABI605_17875 [Rhizobacter sp.]
MRRRGERLAIAAALSLGAGTALASSAPQDGHYDATLCVSVAASPANCGEVEVDLSDGSQAQVRVNDITFQLWLYPSRLSVALMHGSMQIHEFESSYAWEGHALQFADAAKGTRYELKLGERKP